MKHNMTFLKRCLALVLALVLVASNANLGFALKAFAVENTEKTVTYGELMANTYDQLTEAEKALLKSGLLFDDDEITYMVPGDNDGAVTIDSVNKRILVEWFDIWELAQVRILANNEVVETIDRPANGWAVDGEFDVVPYSYNGDAFTVEADLEVNANVPALNQMYMLNAAADLKAGISNLEAIEAVDADLAVVVEAIPALNTLIKTAESNYVNVSYEFKDAVATLENQVALDGTLTLCALNKDYEPNTKTLVEYGDDYEEALYETYDALLAIMEDRLCNNAIIDGALEKQDPAAALKWGAFKNILAGLVAELEKVVNDPWAALYNIPLNLALTDAEYAQVDTILAAIEEPTKIAEEDLVEDYLLDAITKRATKALVSVTVEVVLMNVENAVDSDKLVTVGKNTVVLDFPENAPYDDIENAVYDKGIVESAIASFGEDYVDGCFEAEWSELPEYLTEPTTLTITFTPCEYYVDVETGDEVIELGVFPYGYQMTLPINENAQKAYDYTIDGELYRQGEVYTVLGDTTIVREEVNAYTIGSLYQIIAECWGNKAAEAVLTSGALKGDVAIYYREPAVQPGDMSLYNPDLTVAEAYSSGYGKELWVPYTYGLNDVVNYFAPGSATGIWEERTVNVTYKLPLADQTAKANAIVADVNTIYTDYAGQKAGMESLLAKKGDVEQLTGMYLKVLKFIISEFDFVADPVENQALRDEFTRVITNIQNDCATDGSGYLDILAMIKAYEQDGMIYYYKNSKTVADQVKLLSSHLTDLAGDPYKLEALKKLVADPGINRPELADKIGNLEVGMATIAAQLTETNDAIDVESANLPVLINVLETAGVVELTANGAPFVISDKILVQDESAVTLIANIVIDGKKPVTVQLDEAVDRGTALTSAMIAELQAKVDAELAVLGDKTPYYNIVNNVTADLNAFLGQELDDNLEVTVTADAKVYTVKIDGEADQTITVNNMTVKLPVFVNEGETITYAYRYTVDGKTGIEAENYTFTTEQIDRLFADGSYTITRELVNVAEEKLNDALENLGGGKDEEDNEGGNEGGSEEGNKPSQPTKPANRFYMEDGTMYVSINPDGEGISFFATGILGMGYDYIGLNGEAFLYGNAEGVAELSAQALVNALLNDETFSEQTLIDLGNNNGGKVLKTTIQLGGYKNGESYINSDLPFVIKLNYAPSQMVDVSKALAAAQGNLHFYSDNGIMVTELNLPEKVYEVYLTAMLAVGEVDTDDMNAINNEIAFMFVYDYIDLVLGNEAITTQTFQNTLNYFDAAAELVGKDLDKDLTAYEGAYQMLRSIFNSVDVTVAGDAPVVLDITATAEGLNQLINASGANLGAYEKFLRMTKELKEGNALTATVTANLVNTSADFEALVIDLDEGIEGAKDAIDAAQAGQSGIIEEAKDNVKGNGLANSIDYTSDLFARIAETTGPAAIYLLDDVKGDLVINHHTVLDLNGKTIDGDIIVNGGKLVIIDSKVATTDAGTVTGKVSGNVTIVSGHYNADVTAFLRDGYTQVNGLVQNAMYTIERDGTEFTVVLNSSFMEEAYVDGYLPSISAVAAEIALDTVLNFYIPANLNVEGIRIYGIDDDYSDIFAFAKMSIGEFFDMNLANVRVDGLSDLTNIIIRDLCQFGDIADALENETKLASYTFQTNPWAIEFKHVADGDYMTVGIVADDEVSRDYTLSLKVVGDNIKKFIPYLRELDTIVVYDESTCTIDIEQPVRDGKHMVLAAGATAHLSLDLTAHGDDGIDHDVYKQILAVIFAYGNPDKAEALVNAIDAKNDTALYAAVNELTVREVINALGAMNRVTTFAEMAAAVGATDKVSGDAATIEHLYHLVACAVGKVLVKIDSLDLNGKVDTAQDLADKVAARVDLSYVDIVVDKAGNIIDRVQAKLDLDTKLAAVDQGNGTYMVYYAYGRSGSVDFRGWGADLTLNETSGMLKVKLFDEFAEDCLWGDANHDNLVNAKDATLVLQYSVDALEADQFFCTLRTDVNGDGEINAKDATLILQHSVGTITKFPVEE